MATDAQVRRAEVADRQPLLELWERTVEVLFIGADYHGQGGGKRLIALAESLASRAG